MKNILFCNNETCKLKDSCFRFLNENPNSKNLFNLKKDICNNYIKWNKDGWDINVLVDSIIKFK
jgi:hypothetical protein